MDELIKQMEAANHKPKYLLVSKYLKFNAEKVRDKKSFEDRYTPVIEYWAKRSVKDLGLTIVSASFKLYYQDGDNVIKNLVTLVLQLHCEIDA